MSEEFRRWGESYEGSDKRFVAKEEAEYEEADLVTVPSSFASRSFREMGHAQEKSAPFLSGLI
jgi:hypothetical protein